MIAIKARFWGQVRLVIPQVPSHSFIERAQKGKDCASQAPFASAKLPLWAVDTSELSSRLSVDIYTFLVWFGYRHLLLQLSCPCRQVQLCNPILS
eukprot:1161003-Pelagomonas_calceolata.AAC.3